MTPIPASPRTSPWHAGEFQMQTSVGVAERMLSVGQRVIRTYMPDEHRAFFEHLPFIVLGSVDTTGDVWATLIAGTPGFMQSPTKHRLDIAAMPDSVDPAAAGIVNGTAIGLLGIELHTRRRNRLNGVVVDKTSNTFGVAVTQSFGNCPQYIQYRDYRFVEHSASAAESNAVRSTQLSARAQALIRQADTFFVASYIDGDDHSRQVDVSHRGGKAGFVRLDEQGDLTIPDFAGNLFFATLGNFLLNPRAGLVFADFETGDLLHLAGEAQVVLESPEIGAFEGAERMWRFTPRQCIFRPAALPLRWAFRADGWSPNSLMTGSWNEAESRLKAAALGAMWRPFKVTKVTDESATIRSYTLVPVDSAGIMAPLAGQHLPIRITPAECGKPVIRTYTLTSAPADDFYRISVRRQGVASRHLHDHINVGDVIEARAPAGQFTVDAGERRPVVLLAAGVGITPMLAMLKYIVHEGLRTRRIRPVWFFHAARSLAERAFSTEIAALARRAQGAVTVTRSLTDTSAAVEGTDYELAGRIDVAALTRVLPLNDYDFYLCGPADFVQNIYDGLRALNIQDGRIHSESFGPSALKRLTDTASGGAPVNLPASVPTPVAFVKSGKEARWQPGSGSLLELAEARGLNPEFGCRGGTCGTCRTKIVEGAVAYAVPTAFKVPDDEALVCCAVPAKTADGGAGRLQLDL